MYFGALLLLWLLMRDARPPNAATA